MFLFSLLMVFSVFVVLLSGFVDATTPGGLRANSTEESSALKWGFGVVKKLGSFGFVPFLGFVCKSL